MKRRGLKHLLLCAMWFYSTIFTALPASIAYSCAVNKTLFLWFCGIVWVVNIFTGLYFVMNYGES